MAKNGGRIIGIYINVIISAAFCRDIYRNEKRIAPRFVGAVVIVDIKMAAF